MARIRTIKPEFWTDDAITECSTSARLLFIGMWNFSDDNGNIDRSAKQLKMKIFPADSIDTEPLIQELLGQNLVIEYRANDGLFLHIRGFAKHQKIDRPSKTSLPLYNDSLRTRRVIDEGSTTEGEGREGKVVSTEDSDTTKAEDQTKAFIPVETVDNSPEIVDKALMEGQRRLVDKRLNLERRGEDENQRHEKPPDSSTVLQFPPINSGVG